MGFCSVTSTDKRKPRGGGGGGIKTVFKPIECHLQNESTIIKKPGSKTFVYFVI